MTEPPNPGAPFRILSLDGGGAKGFYTLGVLREIEAMAGKRLCEVFPLIFGTSTGSIIATLLALGYAVDAIHTLYRDNVPTVMKAWTKGGKTAALHKLADDVFGEQKFDTLKTGIGIVSTNWETERPMIFKAEAAQAHGRRASFEPGFGCTLADAVEASCSAYPFFEKKKLTNPKGDKLLLIDGGYCANNPTLYAIADGLKVTGQARSALRVVSVGVGQYPQPSRSAVGWALSQLVSVQLLQKTLEVNTASMEQLRQILFGDIATVRISDTFERPELATDMFEHDLEKLALLRRSGAESFAKRETELSVLLEMD